MRKWIALILAAAAGAALAHTDESLDGVKAPHGGQLRMAGPYHFELVVSPVGEGVRERPIVVYLTDHAGKNVPAAQASGLAEISAGDIQAIATLAPGGDNRLAGVARFAMRKDMRVTLSIRMGDGKEYKASFTPLDKPAAKHAH